MTILLWVISPDRVAPTHSHTQVFPAQELTVGSRSFCSSPNAAPQTCSLFLTVFCPSPPPALPPEAGSEPRLLSPHSTGRAPEVTLEEDFFFPYRFLHLKLVHHGSALPLAQLPLPTGTEGFQHHAEEKGELHWK